mmetsp:Transcript_3636/g.5275  ORF Transcript_3636/g.5275 Transcript_3636/m.5275 type:complete len:255 (-) Transcript_3636:29-793(-)
MSVVGRSLAGLSAIVTGGASGLGRATAEKLASCGARVVIADLPNSDGEAIAAGIQGGLASFAPTDVTNDDDVAKAIEMTGDRLDIAVNCAGVCYAIKTLGKKGMHPLDKFSQTMDVNVTGTFNVCRRAAEKMSTNPGGSGGVLINTASIAGYEGQIGQAAYASSKAAIIGMTLPLARDLMKQGIRVNTIAPGLFDTVLLAGLPEKVRQELAQTVPNPSRLGDPREFAELVEYIAKSEYINGETIRLDGALRMQP